MLCYVRIQDGVLLSLGIYDVPTDRGLKAILPWNLLPQLQVNVEGVQHIVNLLEALNKVLKNGHLDYKLLLVLHVSLIIRQIVISQGLLQQFRDLCRSMIAREAKLHRPYVFNMHIPLVGWHNLN